MRKLILAISLVVPALVAPAQPSTRGVGVYPGDPAQSFAPTLVIDSHIEHNLALHRLAYHSSSHDYNLTAQLVTDGIVHTTMPRYTRVRTSAEGELPKREREHLFDDNPVTTVTVPGSRGWVEVELAGGDQPYALDRLELTAAVRARVTTQAGWRCEVLGSDDGETWQSLGRSSGEERPLGRFTPSVRLDASSSKRYVRFAFSCPGVTGWDVGLLALFAGGQRLRVSGPHDFISAWKSAGAGTQWVVVDLGARCELTHARLFWLAPPASGSLQVSNDRHNWRAIGQLGSPSVDRQELRFEPTVAARYVRVLCDAASSPEGYVLSELEVYGRGGPVATPHAAPALHDRQLELAGGGWRLQRGSEVNAAGEQVATPGFPDEDWLVATVPGTVLTSYANLQAVPDPDFGDNQLMISDSFFYADFWYRTELTAPSFDTHERLWLEIGGINWKAEVFCNSTRLGTVEGGFMRGRFDVTEIVRPGQRCAVAVCVQKNANPGCVKQKTYDNPDRNGGVLGADNPTFHASVGWDWIPTIRGRNCGIWGEVMLRITGPVTLEAPLVTTALPLPDISSADVTVTATLVNHQPTAVVGVLSGHIAEVTFSHPVNLAGSAVTTVTLDPASTPALRLANPRLWWPAGYGEQHLYDVGLSFSTSDGATSDTREFATGIRQFTYSEEGGVLKIWINGRRFIARGGNWGFPESMLRYRAREYDAAVRYHQEMNFTMIRNWVGQTPDDAFFDACDRHGIVVWQDFWLANPWDGPDPDDNLMFLRNATDFIRRIRNHPSVGLYCGRNEGNPPTALDDGLDALVATLHPGLHYISHSSTGVVSGGGPYRAMPVKEYFAQRATPTLHSEMGMPNIVTFDSLRQMMRVEDRWPRGEVWGMHDFCLNGAQGGASFIEMIDTLYGGAETAEDWTRLAQLVNYDGYRAMFEAQSKHRMGLLLWMSHPAWPSFVWQTYDYYLEPTAAYFGAKKACEPLHIQWNALTGRVEVVNYSAGDRTGLRAAARLVNLDGTVVWRQQAELDSSEDSTTEVLALEAPEGLSPVYFVCLELEDDDSTVSENLYWRGTNENDLRALRQLPEVMLAVSTTLERSKEVWTLTSSLANPSEHPAVMVRLKAVRSSSGDRILPAIYSDNYVTLLPGQETTIVTELANPDTRGETPAIVVDGLNVTAARQ